ncbi:hypothetical protein AB0I82_35750, partial [Streptomyces sp. NPDC050315]
DRLVYQARLRSRYGRGWRRKAPVEAMMPLRLSRYGVALSDTAPAGLAAAGIKEPFALAAVRDGNGGQPASLPQTMNGPSAGRDETEPHSLADDGARDAAVQQRLAVQESPAGQEPAPVHRNLSDFSEAFAAYIAQYFDYPSARQFGLYLMDSRGMTDPQTGGPITEPELRPILKELRRRHEQAMTDPVTDSVTDPKMTGPAVTDAGLTDAVVTATMTDATTAREPVTASDGLLTPTASATADSAARGEIPEQLSLGASTGATRGTADAMTGEEPWEAVVTDTGEATARMPQHDAAEEDAEQQRIKLAIKWLEEAERPGAKKLSGAEVARRLQVSPSTGQRLLRKAKDMREEQRPRLWSVSRHPS